jgi:eukaryotic-like serine/threonine-protein kinase
MSGETVLNGRYRLTAQHASGGMAVIYKAIDMALGRTVAIKILRPSLTTDPTFITRFQNEARSIANLSHPNIVTVHDVGSDGPTHYIVMEFVEGQDLKKIVRTQGALSVDRALKISISICAGLGFAHRAGIVHADVKPQNILLNKDDVVKLTDFGIAQALSDTQPTQRQSVVWGSPHYFAPEQAQGEKPTAASDVYAIGIVMFEMLTGRLPYVGSNQQELALAHIREAVPLVTEYNPAVSQELGSIIQKVMSKEPSARFRTADQLGRILITYRDRSQDRTIPGVSLEDPRPQAPAAARPTQTRQPGVTPPPPPPPPGQSQQRSSTPPPPVQGGMSTQRYNPAPEAPGAINYGRPSIPRPSDSRPLTPQQGYGAPGFQAGGDSGPMSPNSVAYRGIGEDRDLPSTFDGVTIALAVLAFLAVACLIPLYIAVLQARLG